MNFERKIIYLVLLCLAGLFSNVALYSQQITTVAVIDLAKVFQSFPSESKGYKTLNDLKERYQTEIDNQIADLDALKREKVLALKEDNFDVAKNLETRINNMANYIDSLSKQRQRDLIARSKAPVSKQFLETLQSAISYVAEERGYTLVLQNTMDGLQWWAPVIDITEDVISRIRVVL